MKMYPLKNVKKVVGTDGKLTVKINSSLEGLTATAEMLNTKTATGMKKLLSLEFCWLPAEVVEAYNNAETAEEKKEVLVTKVYGNCKLNCKGCYAKQDNLFNGNDLIHPETILDLIEEAVKNLGTETIKYLGPSEFFRDKDVFKHLDRFEKMGVILGIFVKDPMFGDDAQVEELFGNLGIHTAEQLVKRLASYKCLRLLYNFRSFDEELTNNLVSGGYKGKENYHGNYKEAQTHGLNLLYHYFAEKEFTENREARLVIVNAPITSETIDEAYEIFTYFVDRGLTVISTTSMQSGCGGKLYNELDVEFMKKFEMYYAKVISHSIKRGLLTSEYVKNFGPSPYAGTCHCMQLCNGLLIRETGQLLRCPGADHAEWRDNIAPEDLVNRGITWAWTRTHNYSERSKVNVGCLAKDRIFTEQFDAHVIELLYKIEHA